MLWRCRIVRGNAADNDRSGMTLPGHREYREMGGSADSQRLNLRDLLETMSEMSGVTQFQELLPNLARILASSVGVQQCMVYLYSDDFTSTSAHLSWGFSPEQMRLLNLTDTFSSPMLFAAERHIVSTRQVLGRIAGEVDESLLPQNPLVYEAGWRGDVMVPFVWNDHVEGIAYLWLAEGERSFHPVQIEIAEGVARQASAAIHHVRMLEAERHSRRQTEMVLDLSRALNSANSTLEIYAALAESVRETLGTDAVSIVVEHAQDPRTGPCRRSMRRVAALGMTPDEMAVRDNLLRASSRLGSSIDRMAREQHEPVIVADLDDTIGDPALRDNLRANGVVELLAAPIFISDELLGVLYSWSRQARRRLEREHLTIVDTMTRHAAASIQRVLLIESERRQRQLTEALLDVNHALERCQNSDELIQIATRAIRQVLNADLASTFVFDSGPQGPATLFADGATDEELAILIRDAETPTETVPVEIDLARDPRVLPIDDFVAAFGSPLPGLPEYLARVGVERAVAVPVVSRQETLGIIYAWYRDPDPIYWQAEVETAGAIAVELAAGLDRLVLVASERRQRSRAETLLSFSRILNRSIESEAVIRSIVATVRDLFPGALVSLAFDEEDPEPEVNAFHQLPFAEDSAFLTLLESAREHLSPEHCQIAQFAIAAVPLSVNQDVLGLMIVAREATHPFSTEDHDLLTALAPQAATAIRRARLYAVAERHIAELTLLHEVGRTIATRSNLSDIFQYIESAIRDVVDYTTGIIALECDDPTQLEVVSIWGVQPGRGTGTRIPVDASILGAVFRSQHPVVVDDAASHPQAWSKRTAVWCSVVCVPLMSGTRAIGAMLLGHQEAAFFSDEDVRLVSLLAGQAGAAIYQTRESERQRELYRAGVEALAAAVDAKDSYIHSHSRQVAELARNVADTLGLGPEEVEQIELAGLLHDVGKIGIPDQILTKPGRLDPQERLVMISHSALGERIVAAHPSLSQLARLIRHHHEWHNGSGYPDGLRGDEVPIGSAIIAVADAFGSMTSHRPYRDPLSLDAARAELRKWSGIQFNPDVVDAFLMTVGDVEGDNLPVSASAAMRLVPIQAIDIITPRILSQIATEISHLTELYPFLNRVQHIVCTELKYDDVHILLVDETQGDLVLAASTTHAELAGRYRIRQGEGLSGEAAMSRTVINCGDVEGDPRARLSDMASKSMLAVPLIVEESVIGLLCSGSAEPHRYSDRDVALMTTIACQIGPAIRVAQLHDQAKRAAMTDGLTGVMNHHTFYQRLEHMIGELDVWDDELHLLIVDVIGLKAINDVHGHLAGDRALRAIAGALKSRIRSEDEVARYGGDEFVVIVRGTPRGGLQELVERICAPVDFALESGYEMTVQLRCGHATAESAHERATELVARADARLYTLVSPTARGTDRLVLPDGHV